MSFLAGAISFRQYFLSQFIYFPSFQSFSSTVYIHRNAVVDFDEFLRHIEATEALLSGDINSAKSSMLAFIDRYVIRAMKICEKWDQLGPQGQLGLGSIFFVAKEFYTKFPKSKDSFDFYPYSTEEVDDFLNRFLLEHGGMAEKPDENLSESKNGT
jgi:hypothetical protein